MDEERELDAMEDEYSGRKAMRLAIQQEEAECITGMCTFSR
jgi:hypothetical protein